MRRACLIVPFLPARLVVCVRVRACALFGRCRAGPAFDRHDVNDGTQMQRSALDPALPPSLTEIRAKREGMTNRVVHLMT